MTSCEADFETEIESFASAPDANGSVTCLKCGHLAKTKFLLQKHQVSHLLAESDFRARFDAATERFTLKTATQGTSCLICKKFLKITNVRDLAQHFWCRHRKVLR